MAASGLPANDGTVIQNIGTSNYSRLPNKLYAQNRVLIANFTGGRNPVADDWHERNEVIAPSNILRDEGGEDVAYVYANTGTDIEHLIYKDSKDVTQIQIVTLTGSVTATATFSLDGINFTAFPTNITSGAVGAGNTAIIEIPEDYNNCYILITVAGTAGTYYLVSN